MRSSTYILAALLVAAVTADCGPRISDRETRYQVALAYGLKAFDQVEQIRFTLNVRKDKRRFRRSWVWHPKTDRVVYNGEIGYSRSDSTLSYNTDQAQVDRWFENDKTWLLFPLQLVWYRGLTVSEDPEPQPLPSGKGTARRLIVTYPSGGYTPGDVYHLYIGDDNRVLAWAYFIAGEDEPEAMTTWEDHRHVGPITVSLERNSPDGGFHVWFTDVAVKLVGMDDWFEAR